MNSPYYKLFMNLLLSAKTFCEVKNQGWIPRWNSAPFWLSLDCKKKR